MTHAAPMHVMILGCGRSGTSIFGELFEHLELYSYQSEPPLGAYLASDFGHPVAVKVPAVDPAYPPTAGLSFPLEALRERVAAPMRFFWIVRHPLDTICSLRPGIANNWGHHPQPPDWRDWQSEPLVAQCAHHWNYLNSVGFNAVSAIAIIKRFEDLIRDPRGFADGICADIGLTASEHGSELDAWANRVQDSDNESFVEAETSRNYSRRDHTVRVGRWRENLTRQDVELVRPIVADTAARFGFELPDPAR